MSSQDNEKSLADLMSAFHGSPHYVVKETQYFEAYFQLFGHLRNTECTFIEIGVLGGGSLFMWREWLGPKARIIGIDLNPEVKKWEEFGFEIFIGDQGDAEFIKNTINHVGGFDALLDDGGHQSFQQIATLLSAVRTLNRSCIIAVEDTSSSFMNDFSRHRNHSFLEYAKSLTDILVARTFSMYPNRFKKVKNLSLIEQFRNLKSIEFFPGIVGLNMSGDILPLPNVVSNMDTIPITDFRYEGKSTFSTHWPRIFESQRVTIHVGKTIKGKVKDIGKKS